MEALGQTAFLQRPSLLVKAARIGAQHYQRRRHLRSILGMSTLPRHESALHKLSEIEAELNALREIRNGTYSVTKHLEVLTAIIGEARLLLRSNSQSDNADVVHVNASASAAFRSATNASRASLIAGSMEGC